MEDPEQAFVEFASSRTDEAGEGLVSDFMASQDARLSKFEANFKRQQGEMTNKIDIVLKAIIDQIWGTLPSDTVKKKLGTHPKPVESQVNEPDMEQEEGNLGNTNSNPQSDPLALIATEQVQKLNSMLESLSNKMEAGTTSKTLTARLPILNPGEYDLWLMRIEQYFLMTDYSPWEVILNVEKQDRRNKMEARGTLLMALLNKDQLKFHSYKDAKLLMEAIEKRLQKLICQLEIQGEVITQEDMNLKLLRSLPSKWKTHALIWRNKEEIETVSLDDLYSNLKIYEPEFIGSTNTSQNSQNVAFVSSNSTNSNSNSSTNEADNTTYGFSAAHTQSNSTSRDNLSDVVIYAFLASQPNSP
ncbi:hypothetical protein Tco_0947827 [Tanacetum coccineum]